MSAPLRTIGGSWFLFILAIWLRHLLGSGVFASLVIKLNGIISISQKLNLKTTLSTIYSVEWLDSSHQWIYLVVMSWFIKETNSTSISVWQYSPNFILPTSLMNMYRDIINTWELQMTQQLLLKTCHSGISGLESSLCLIETFS